MGIGVALGLKKVYEHFSRRVLWAVLGACVALQLYQAAMIFPVYAERFRFKAAIQSDIEAQCPPGSFVLLGDVVIWNAKAPDFFSAGDMKRNPFLRGSRLFVWDESEAAVLRPWYPDYQVCRYRAVL